MVAMMMNMTLMMNARGLEPTVILHKLILIPIEMNEHIFHESDQRVRAYRRAMEAVKTSLSLEHARSPVEARRPVVPPKLGELVSEDSSQRSGRYQTDNLTLNSLAARTPDGPKEDAEAAAVAAWAAPRVMAQVPD